MSSYFAIGYSLQLIIVLLACQRRKAMRGAEELSLHPPGWETGLQSSQAEPSPRGLPGDQGCEELPCSPRWAGEDAKGFPNFMPSPLLLQKQARGGGTARSRPGTCPQLHFPGRCHHVCDSESMGSPSCCSSWGGPHNLLQPTAFPGYGTSILRHYSP